MQTAEELRMLTILQIADELKVAESTVRYWRDRYMAYIPVTGKGRQRRYPKESLAAFRYIQEASKQNISQQEIESNLVKITGIEIKEFHTDSQSQRSAVESQDLRVIENTESIIAVERNRGEITAIEQLAAAMQIIADQRELITVHEKRIGEIEIRQGRIEESLKTRDEALMATIREIQEKKQRSWWKFWK